LRCVRRRRESFAPFPRVMLGSEGVVKTGGDGVRGLKTRGEWGTKAGAAVPPVDCAHTQVTGPRAGDTTGPPQCVPATAGDRWLPAHVRPRSAKKRRV